MDIRGTLLFIVMFYIVGLKLGRKWTPGPPRTPIHHLHSHKNALFYQKDLCYTDEDLFCVPPEFPGTEIYKMFYSESTLLNMEDL